MAWPCSWVISYYIFKETQKHTILLRIDRENLCSNFRTFFGSIYILWVYEQQILF